MLNKIIAAQARIDLELRGYLAINYNNLGEVASLTQLSNRESQVFQVIFAKGDKQIPYCFRIAPTPDQEPCYFILDFRDRLKFESDILFFCKNQGLDIVCMVPRVDNKFFGVTDKGILMMYEFAAGQPVGTAVVSKHVPEEAIKTIFKWLGQFHAKSTKFQNDIKPDRSEAFMFNFNVKKQKTKGFQDRVSVMKKRVQELIETCKKDEVIDTWLMGPIHGDFHAENMHLNGTKLSVIDWELCGIGLRLWDIGTAMRSLKLSEKHLNLVIDSYVKKFTDNRPLQQKISNLVREFGTDFAEIRHLWFYAMHCDRKSGLNWEYPFF